MVIVNSNTEGAGVIIENKQKRNNDLLGVASFKNITLDNVTSGEELVHLEVSDLEISSLNVTESRGEGIVIGAENTLDVGFITINNSELTGGGLGLVVNGQGGELTKASVTNSTVDSAGITFLVEAKLNVHDLNVDFIDVNATGTMYNREAHGVYIAHDDVGGYVRDFTFDTIKVNNVTLASLQPYGDDFTLQGVEIHSINIEDKNPDAYNEIVVSSLTSVVDPTSSCTGLTFIDAKIKDLDFLKITDLHGKNEVAGLRAYYNNDISIAETDISNLEANNEASGVLVYEESKAELPSLTVSDVTSLNDKSFGLRVLQTSELSSEFVKIEKIKGKTLTVGVAAEEKSKVIIDKADIDITKHANREEGDVLRNYAVYADASEVVINGGKVSGAIVSMNENGRVSIKGANSNDTYLTDVYAIKNGVFTADLANGSSMTGSVDDYWDIEDGYSSASTSRLVDIPRWEYSYNVQDWVERPVSKKPGEASINLNNGIWHATGRSFVSNLTFQQDGGILDMQMPGHNTVLIKKMTGSGDIRMTFGKNVAGVDGLIHTDILYVQNMDADAHYTISASVDNTVSSLDDLDGLRFATTNKLTGTDGSTPNSFTIKFQDVGVVNREFEVKTEDYDPNSDINAAYNGTDGSDGIKPGDEYVDKIFENGGTNWYIQTGELLPPKPDPNPNPDQNPDLNPDQNPGQKPDVNPGSGTSISDAGNALLATGRANYWSAVEVDRYLNRVSDLRHADGNDGLWIRARHERIGTDRGLTDFRTKKTTYQLGIDHLFSDGLRVGMAVDYTDGETDYRYINGDGKSDRIGLIAYSTLVKGGGAYLDVIGRIGRLKNEFNIVNGSGNQVKADYDNNMWGFSIEGGYQFGNGVNGFFIEPSAQMQYTHVTDASYTTSQRTRVQQDSIESLISRVGMRLGENLNEGRTSVYTKIDAFYEFLGKEKFKMRDVTTSSEGLNLELKNDGNWFDLGFGCQTKFTDRGYFFADVEYRFGNNLDKTWIFNTGARVDF